MDRWAPARIFSVRVAAVAVALLVAAPAQPARAATWTPEKSHTNIGFSVRHLFTSVQGKFTEFNGSIEFDPADPLATVVKGSIVAASIDTGNEKRDKHLRSSDFFNVEKYPSLDFKSTGVTGVEGNRATLEGKLTIHGVTRPVQLDVTFLGEGKDPWGNRLAGFKATVTIDRKDFGLTWNETLETGGLLVGDEVEIRLDVEGALSE
ncbi:MAG: YceI family protein [Proteobacteria bacterium]|nr:YceI family protein [Pseudomonadota bacterium]